MLTFWLERLSTWRGSGESGVVAGPARRPAGQLERRSPVKEKHANHHRFSSDLNLFIHRSIRYHLSYRLVTVSSRCKMNSCGKTDEFSETFLIFLVNFDTEYLSRLWRYPLTNSVKIFLNFCSIRDAQIRIASVNSKPQSSTQKRTRWLVETCKNVVGQSM